MTHRSQARIFLLIILAFALGLRLLLWSQPLHEPANDEVEYITVARDLLEGRGWSFYEQYHWLRAPLYPLFLAASWQLAGDDGWPYATRALHLAALPNILLSVVSVYLTYALTMRLVDHRRSALLAALIAAVLWTNATFASLYMSETLFTVLFQVGMLMLLHAADQQPASQRWLLLIAAGAALGLAALTRSLALLFLPIAALWLALQVSRRNPSGDVRRRSTAPLLTATLFLLSAGMVIAPWTIRNYQAYGGFILIETGLSYNLWVFNEPREDRDTIHRILENISNPVERSNYATARGLERLREDPAILVRKLWPNWVFLARVKPIQDRFLMEHYVADVDLPLFVAALIFDDLLYLLIAIGAIIGLAHAVRIRNTPSDQQFHQSCHLPVAPAALCLLWIGYAIATMLLTHGEARYRHFLFPTLIPYAAWTFTTLTQRIACFTAFLRYIDHYFYLPCRARHPLPAECRPKFISVTLWGVRFRECSTSSTRFNLCENCYNRRRLPISALLVCIFLWTVLTAYPWSWAGENLARGSHALIGDVWMALGAPDRAARAYLSALSVKATPDGWLRLGHAHLARGEIAQARIAYRAAWDASRAYFIASARLGDLERSLGNLDEARRAFAGYYANEQRVTDWSWRVLGQNPPSSLDVGDGLDFGYVGGVYPAEELQGVRARWSAGRALLRLGSAEANTQALLTLRLAAPHPDRNVVPAHICVDGTCRSISLSADWRTCTFIVNPQHTTILVEVESPTFTAADGRRLGVLIDRVHLTPLVPGSE
jgi:4-amino-4-deoxy-L-arabinose transferase-like glycosyltransferase